MGNPLLGNLMRRPGLPGEVAGFVGSQINNDRLAAVPAPDARLLTLYEGALHSEGPVWQPSRNRLLWSDVSNRRLLAWYADGHVEAAIDPTSFINGNALLDDGRVVHCEHGRRCISLSEPDLARQPEPLVTHFEGRRLNSPNDVAVAPDGTIWFTDPIFGIAMPSQGGLADPELDSKCLSFRSGDAVAPTWNEIGQLAALVVLRTALKFFLQKEIDKAAERRPSGSGLAMMDGPAH